MGRREKKETKPEPLERQKSARNKSITTHNSFAKPQNRQSFRGRPEQGNTLGVAPAYPAPAYGSTSMPVGSPLNSSGGRGNDVAQFSGFAAYNVASANQFQMGANPAMMGGQPFYPMDGSGHMTPQQYMMMMNGGGGGGGFFPQPVAQQQMFMPSGVPSPQYHPQPQQPYPQQAYTSNMPSPQPAMQRQQSMRGNPGQPVNMPQQGMNTPSPQGGGLQRQQSMRGPVDQQSSSQPGLQRRQSMRGNPGQPVNMPQQGMNTPSPQGGGLQRQQSMRGPVDQQGSSQPGLQRRQSMRGNPGQPVNMPQQGMNTPSPQGGGLQRQQSMRGNIGQDGSEQPALQRRPSMRGAPNPTAARSQTDAPAQLPYQDGIRRTASSGASLGGSVMAQPNGPEFLARSARDATNPNYTNLFPAKHSQALPAQLAPIQAQTPPPPSTVDGYTPQQLQQLQSLPPLPAVSLPGGRIMNAPFPFPVPAAMMPAMAAHIPPNVPAVLPGYNGWTGDAQAGHGQGQIPSLGGGFPAGGFSPPPPGAVPVVSPSAGSGGLQRAPSILNRKSSFKKDKKADKDKDGEESKGTQRNRGRQKEPDDASPAPVMTSSSVTPSAGGPVVGSARKLTAEEKANLMRQRETEYMMTKLQQLERERAEEERLRQLRFQQAMLRNQSTFAACSAEAAEEELARQENQRQQTAQANEEFTREPTAAPIAQSGTDPAATPAPAVASTAKPSADLATTSARPAPKVEEPVQKPTRLRPKRTGSARQQQRMENVMDNSAVISDAAVGSTSAQDAPRESAAAPPSRPVPADQAFNAEPAEVSDGTRSNRATVSTRAQSAGRRRSSATQRPADAAAPARQHRCPTLMLYEMPLRSRKNKSEPVDDSANPLKTYGDDLTDVRVTTTSGDVQKFIVDEVIAHRKGSHLIDSKVLTKVKSTFLSGRAAAVIGIDSEQLGEAAGAFESPSSLAQQRLLRDVMKDVARLGEKVSSADSSGESYVDVGVSFALVKKMSAQMAAELEEGTLITGPAPPRGSTRTHEVVDLLPDETRVVPFRQEVSPLYGARLAGVEYRCLQNEDEFGGAVVCAQANAGKFCGELLDKVAAAADPEEKSRLEDEIQSCVFVITCVLTYHKDGAVISVNTELTPSDVEAPEASEEDDDDAILAPYRRTTALDTSAPSASSDTIISVLTCVSMENRVDIAKGVLSGDSSAPLTVFEPLVGGPCYTAVVMGANPAEAQSAEGLSVQKNLAAQLHPKPLHGSLWGFVMRHTYEIVMARQALADAPFGSDAQRNAKVQIKKSTQALEQVAPLLTLDRSKRFSIQN